MHLYAIGHFLFFYFKKESYLDQEQGAQSGFGGHNL